MHVAGKTVLLTGATGGIGHAIARVACGARRVADPHRAPFGGCSSRSPPRRAGARCRSISADRAAVERLIDDAGDIDILVANAALPASGDVLSSPRARSTARSRSTCARRSRSRGGWSSRWRRAAPATSSSSRRSPAKSASPGSAIYSATKFGIRGFALGLREDMRDRGVGVTTVFPGFIRDAGMFAESGTKLPPWVGTRTPEHVRGRGAARDRAQRGRARRRAGWVACRRGVAQVAPEISGRLQRALAPRTSRARSPRAKRHKR